MCAARLEPRWQRRVQELEKRCRQAERASARLARVAGGLWAPLVEQELGAEGASRLVGDPASSTALVLDVAGVRWIREARDGVIEADLAHAAAQERYRELAGRRDAVSRALYDLVVELRERCRASNAVDEKHLLGVSGRTPRTPDLLCRTSRVVVAAVKRWDDEPPAELKGLVPGPYVRRIEGLANDLEAALDAVALADVRKRAARRARKTAIEHCEWSLLHGSRLVESALSLLGREELAFEIRGRRRPGRPSKKFRQAVRRAREGFPWLPEAVRRARESFSPLASLVTRARESFSSLAALVRRARESFSSRA